MSKINKEMVLGLFLGFVVIWFGVNEIMHPANWTVFVPSFLKGMGNLQTLVMVHGFVLVLAGLAVAFNFHRRVAAIVLLVLIADVIFTLISSSGLDELAVRDIGLFGMALALAIKN